MEQIEMTKDAVNHPQHYESSVPEIECIQVVRHFNFNRGNAIKYIWRAGKKDPSKEVEDLEKAIWYIKDEIERISNDVKRNNRRSMRHRSDS